MKRGVLFIFLFVLSIAFASAVSYQTIEWRTMKPGDTWVNISGGYNIKLNTLLDSKHISTTLTKYGTAQINLTKGTLFQYNVGGYFFNVTSITSGSATIVILKKICTPDWQCSSWDSCTNGAQWRTCKDVNECGMATGMPSESRACVTCSPSWLCTMWNACINNKQHRSCTDLHNCPTATAPSENRACQSEDSDDSDQTDDGADGEDSARDDGTDSSDDNTDEADDGSDSDNLDEDEATGDEGIDDTDDTTDGGNDETDSECDESWQCSTWSQCINNQQVRACTDTENCGTFFDLPAMIRVCGALPNNQQNQINNYDDAEELVRIFQLESPGQQLRPVNFTFGYVLPDPINIDIPIMQFFSPAYFIWWFLLLLLYIYISLTYTFIGRRARVYHYGVAWIPVIGPLIVSCRAAQMGHWPVYLLVAAFLSSIVETLLMFSPFAIYSFALSSLNYILVIVFSIFWFIWTWKMFRAVSRPGWWSLVNLVPFIGWAVFLVFLGVAAWGKFSPATSTTAEKDKIKTKKSKDKK